MPGDRGRASAQESARGRGRLIAEVAEPVQEDDAGRARKQMSQGSQAGDKNIAELAVEGEEASGHTGFTGADTVGARYHLCRYTRCNGNSRIETNVGLTPPEQRAEMQLGCQASQDAHVQPAYSNFPLDLYEEACMRVMQHMGRRGADGPLVSHTCQCPVIWASHRTVNL